MRRWVDQALGAHASPAQATRARVLALLRRRAAANAAWTGQQRYSWRLTLSIILFVALILRQAQPGLANVVLYGLCLAALFLPLVVGPRTYTVALVACALAGTVLARQANDLLILSLVMIGMAGSQLPLLLAAIAGVGVAVAFAVGQVFGGTTEVLPQNVSWFAATFAGGAAAHIRRIAAARQAAMLAQLERSNAELRLAHEQLRLDSQRMAELAAAEERERIAREIHDVLAHTLTVLVVQVGAVKRLVSRDPARAQQQLDLITQLTREGLSEVRRSVHALHSSDEEGEPAIAALVAGFAERTGTDCRFTTAPDLPALPPALSKVLYRVTQEALTNAVRHGNAQQINVHMERDGTHLTLAIEDNGIGVAAAPPVTGGGNGLPGARERLRAFGGALDARSRPEGGYRVKVTLPLVSMTEGSSHAGVGRPGE